MEFRKAMQSDLASAFAIIEQGRARLASLGIDQWQAGSPSFQSIESDIMQGIGYVALDDGFAVGYVMLNPTGEPAYDNIHGCWLTDTSSYDSDYLAVHRVAVDDEALGKGVAKFMLEKAGVIARVQQLNSLRIDTHPGNLPMQNLLKKCGFTKCGSIMLPASSGEPTLERLAYEKMI